jgi:hypothetical protein
MAARIEKVKCLFTIILVSYACLQTTAQSQSPTVEILVTHAGDTNRVDNLYVQYVALKMSKYIGEGYPTTLNKSFHFMIEGTQGGAKWTNPIEIPFDSIRRITFARSYSGKLKLDDLKARGPEILVEKRNESSISIKRINLDNQKCYTYEEIDPTGKMIKSFPFDILYYHKNGQERIECYIGSMTTPLGEKGGFKIGVNEVRSIEFQ